MSLFIELNIRISQYQRKNKWFIRFFSFNYRRIEKSYGNNVNQIINEDLTIVIAGDKKFNYKLFAFLVAKIESVDAKKCIYVLLEIMGARRKLEINLERKLNFIKI